MATVHGEITRHPVSIILLDSRGTLPVVQWDLVRCAARALGRRESAGDGARGVHPGVRPEVRGHRAGRVSRCLTGVDRVSGRGWSAPLRPRSIVPPTEWRRSPTACARSVAERAGTACRPIDARLTGVDPAIAAYVAARDPEWFSLAGARTDGETDAAAPAPWRAPSEPGERGSGDRRRSGPEDPPRVFFPAPARQARAARPAARGGSAEPATVSRPTRRRRLPGDARERSVTGMPRPGWPFPRTPPSRTAALRHGGEARVPAAGPGNDGAGRALRRRRRRAGFGGLRDRREVRPGPRMRGCRRSRRRPEVRRSPRRPRSAGPALAPGSRAADRDAPRSAGSRLRFTLGDRRSRSRSAVDGPVEGPTPRAGHRAASPADRRGPPTPPPPRRTPPTSPSPRSPSRSRARAPRHPSTVPDAARCPTAPLLDPALRAQLALAGAAPAAWTMSRAARRAGALAWAAASRTDVLVDEQRST